MDLQLKEKVIITGGAKGIGVAIVRSCAGEGAVPVIVGRDTEAGRHLQQRIAERRHCLRPDHPRSLNARKLPAGR